MRLLQRPRTLPQTPLGWFGILRLGLVQAALGAVVVMTTTILNRIMVVELALPAVVPGALVAVHYGVQILRPRWGHGADAGGRRTPWIVGGMAALALGGTGAAAGVALMAASLPAGLLLATVSYLLVGAGVGAAGTALLTLAATRVAPDRRAPAAALVWIMMILGFAITAGLVGTVLDPFTLKRLLGVAGTVSAAAFALALVAIIGVEDRAMKPAAAALRAPAPRQPFGSAVRAAWAEAEVRRFTLFVFTAMLAYGAQDLVLDPFAGRVLGLTPGETARLSGLQHGGALAGMLAVALAGYLGGRRHPAFLRRCAVLGCFASALMLGALALAGAAGSSFPLRAAVAALGFGNGIFAVSAVGAMMVQAGDAARAGLRMGLWGAAQALAFGLGALAGPALVAIGTALFGAAAPAYASTFLALAALFLLSARLVASGAPARAPAEPRDAALATVTP